MLPEWFVGDIAECVKDMRHPSIPRTLWDMLPKQGQRFIVTDVRPSPFCAKVCYIGLTGHRRALYRSDFFIKVEPKNSDALDSRVAKVPQWA